MPDVATGWLRVTRRNRGDHFHMLDKVEVMVGNEPVAELPVCSASVESRVGDPDRLGIEVFRFEEVESE